MNFFVSGTRSSLLVFTCLVISCLVQENGSNDSLYDYENTDDPCSESQPDCTRYSSCGKCFPFVTNCQCDSLCIHYNDCCLNTEGSRNRSNFHLSADDWKCLPDKLMHSTSPIAVITNCPVNSPPNQRNLCQSLGELLVYGSTSGLIYRNRMCALCHGEQKTTIPPVFTHCPLIPRNNLTHTKELVERLIAGDQECHLRYNLSSAHRCKQAISTCPTNAELADREKCANYPASFVYKTDDYGKSVNPPFRNEWCARCNTIDRFTCVPPSLVGIFGEYLPGFESLISPDLLDEMAQEWDEKKLVSGSKCSEGEVQVVNFGCLKANFTELKNAECSEWVNSSNFIMRNDTGVLFVVLSDFNITSNDFLLDGDQALICVKNSTARSATRMQTTNSKLTLVLVISSLCCIAVQLALYSYYKQLRNVPGLVVIFLIAALFLAFLLYLVGLFLDAGTAACLSISVFEHYFFLASFFWTNVMAFDVTRMLVYTFSSQSKRRLLWYSLYAWCCPFIIVLAAVLTDQLGSPLAPSYGRQLCWLSSSNGLIAFFLAPLFFLVAMNIVLYVFSAMAIAKAAKETKMVNPDLRERLLLSVKLIVVMGLPWVFAVVSAFTSSIVLNYLFVIFNASQGVFIFCAFVFSKTVLKLMCHAKGMKVTQSNRTVNSSAATTYRQQSRESQQPTREEHSDDNLLHRNNIGLA